MTRIPASLIGVLALLGCVFFSQAVWAYSGFSPWDPTRQEGLGSLVYASSSTADVARVAGHPDDIVRTEQMFPLVENYYYFDEGGSGAATVFVFQNGLLMGMHYKSPDNQLVDLTYFLTNNNDRAINWPLNGGYALYNPNNFPFFRPFDQGR